MNVIAIDFDDTATAYPDEVNRLYDNKENFIVIYTARPSYMAKETANYLQQHNIRYHALVMGKLRADMYIDDKNVGGLQWPK